MIYDLKAIEEIARGVAVGVGVAVVGYLVSTLATGGIPADRAAWIGLLSGAAPIVYAAIRAAITRVTTPPAVIPAPPPAPPTGTPGTLGL